MSRRVVIVGGGVAGLEALFGLHDLAGKRAELTLVADQPEFENRPMLVEEPFDLGPAARYALAPLVDAIGGKFVQAAVRGVRADRHRIELGDGTTMAYDHLILCLGGRLRPALEGAITFPGAKPLHMSELLRSPKSERGIAFIVPPGVAWALPLYELALMTQRLAVDLHRTTVALKVYTHEPEPLALFGPTVSAAIADLLAARHIDVQADAFVHRGNGGELKITPGNHQLREGTVIALAAMTGPAITGVPADAKGFIPTDEHARVRGVEDVYAAGDGTSFPIKQGGLATQQADAAACHLAHRLGVAVAVEPFHPVLRGKLITGDESLHLRADLTGGAGEGVLSLDSLWWPSQKISGRYLAAWLARRAEAPNPLGHPACSLASTDM